MFDFSFFVYDFPTKKFVENSSSIYLNPSLPMSIKLHFKVEFIKIQKNDKLL